jgi:hypothetical protein
MAFTRHSCGYQIGLDDPIVDLWEADFGGSSRFPRCLGGSRPLFRRKGSTPTVTTLTIMIKF